MAALPAVICRKYHKWVKLSNSGDFLKLLIPSSNRKIICGWTNYSEKVISQKMIEREMEYRGSKSILGTTIPTGQIPNIVKEQRVDGSCIRFNSLILRCTLMGFERNFQPKILSNQINTYCIKTIVKNNNYIKLDPLFITGFVDAEGCFSILIQPRSDTTTKWRIKAIFHISLDKKDINILENIRYTLGVGKIYNSSIYNKVYYRVESFKEVKVIINHFNNYPLVTAKKIDFALFSKCFDIISSNEHITNKGLLKLVELKSSLNKGLSKTLQEKFPEVLINKRIEYKFEGIPGPTWISGFVSGDGSFNVITTQKGRVQLKFSVHLHIREEAVILGINNYLSNYNTYDIGNHIYYTNKSVMVQIVNISDIMNTIIPFFDKYNIYGKKSLDFNDFKLIANMMNNKEHLTSKGLKKIILIKENMNLNRK